MAIITEGHERYAQIRDAWASQGQPRSFLFQAQGYFTIRQASAISFAEVNRTDSRWLDRQDPSRRWHGIYGYELQEPNT